MIPQSERRRSKQELRDNSNFEKNKGALKVGRASDARPVPVFKLGDREMRVAVEFDIY